MTTYYLEYKYRYIYIGMAVLIFGGAAIALGVASWQQKGRDDARGQKKLKDEWVEADQLVLWHERSVAECKQKNCRSDELKTKEGYLAEATAKRQKIEDESQKKWKKHPREF